MLSNGHQIGSYRIVEPIAGGGMGMVYVAEHVTFQERVAIKALMDSLAMNERVRFRFEQEAYVQRQLSHPNIVEVKDFITVGGTLVIVMELVDGPSLFQEMEQERRGMWPVEGAMAIMGPVLDAVAYAHARGVVHRDLKPANVLLDRTGGQAWPGIPKITDFGVAKILSTKSGMTRTGSQLGTFGYMAPEQYRGNLDTDARADVFALGMMIWRLLAGRLPVDVEDMVALTQMYAGQEPIPDIRTINKQVPEAFAASLARALAIDPAQRPADAGELARALVAAPVSPASQPPPDTVHLDPGGPVPTGAPTQPTLSDPEPSSGGSSGVPKAALALPLLIPLVAIAGLIVVGGGIGLALLVGSGGSSKRPDDALDRLVDDGFENSPGSRSMPSSPSSAPSTREVPVAAPEPPPAPVQPAVSSSRYTSPSTGYAMVKVSAGSFWMGSSGESGRDADETRHRVSLTRPYYVGETEVTQKVFEDVMGFNPSQFGGSQRPVDSVTWYQAVDMANRMSRSDGLQPAYSGSGDNIRWDASADGYRLMTEAEWEYAARGGDRTELYSGSGNLGTVGWYMGNSGAATHSVRGKAPNGLGLYDMTGNVWEWVWDWYGNYPTGSVTDPINSRSKGERCMRGGDWKDTAAHNRVANRGYVKPNLSNFSGGRIGFRLARYAD